MSQRPRKEARHTVWPSNVLSAIINYLKINDQTVKNVSSAKLLGVIVCNDLTWDKHVLTIIAESNSRVYYLVMLKRFGAHSHMLTVYNSKKTVYNFKGSHEITFWAVIINDLH